MILYSLYVFPEAGQCLTSHFCCGRLVISRTGLHKYNSLSPSPVSSFLFPCYMPACLHNQCCPPAPPPRQHQVLPPPLCLPSHLHTPHSFPWEQNTSWFRARRSCSSRVGRDRRRRGRGRKRDKRERETAGEIDSERGREIQAERDTER